MQSNACGVYSLSDPDTLEVRYIGATTCFKNRFLTHLSSARNGYKARVGIWIRELLSNNKLPNFSIIHKCSTKSEALKLEKIEIFSRSNLLNGMFSGGANHKEGIKRFPRRLPCSPIAMKSIKHISIQSGKKVYEVVDELLTEAIDLRPKNKTRKGA